MAALPPKDPRKSLVDSIRPHQPLNRAKSPLVAARKDEEKRVRLITDPPRKENQTIAEQYAAARNRLKQILPTVPLTRETKLATPHHLSVQYWKQRMTEHEAAVARHKQQGYYDPQASVPPSAAVSRTNSNGSRTTEPFSEPVPQQRPRSVTPRNTITPRSLVSGARTPSPSTNPSPTVQKPSARVRSTTPSPTSDFVASTLPAKQQRARSNEPFDHPTSKAPSPAASDSSNRKKTPEVRMTRTQLLRGRSPTIRDPATEAANVKLLTETANRASSAKPATREDSTQRASSAGSRTSPLPSWCSSVVVTPRKRVQGSIPAVRTSVASNSPNAVLRRESPVSSNRTPSPGSSKIRAPGMTSALGRALASVPMRPTPVNQTAAVTAAAKRLAAATAAVAIRPTAVPPLAKAAAPATAVARTESTVSVSQPPLRARV